MSDRIPLDAAAERLYESEMQDDEHKPWPELGEGLKGEYRRDVAIVARALVGTLTPEDTYKISDAALKAGREEAWSIQLDDDAFGAAFRAELLRQLGVSDE